MSRPQPAEGRRVARDLILGVLLAFLLLHTGLALADHRPLLSHLPDTLFTVVFAVAAPLLFLGSTWVHVLPAVALLVGAAVLIRSHVRVAWRAPCYLLLLSAWFVYGVFCASLYAVV